MDEMNLEGIIFYKDFTITFERVNEWVRRYKEMIAQNKQAKYLSWRSFAKTIGYCQAILSYGFDLSNLPLKDYEAYFEERRSLEKWLYSIEDKLF